MSLRRLFSILSAALICLSCNNDESAVQAANSQLVKEVHLLLNRHDWKELVKRFADSVSIKKASAGGRLIRQSNRQYINNCRAMQQMFPRLSQHITQLYAAGTHHVIVETVTKGITPDTVPLSYPNCTIFTIENQKISRLYLYHSIQP